MPPRKKVEPQTVLLPNTDETTKKKAPTKKSKKPIYSHYRCKKCEKND